MVELSRFVEIGNSRREKENGDVDPVGRFADHTVIGVEQDRDQKLAEKDPTELYTPKIFAIAKEKALYNGKDQHRPKE